jgi:diguanylate cyclase (GGDEF)-like protein
VEIWRWVASLAVLAALGLILALVDSRRKRHTLRAQIVGLNAQVTALHQALKEQQSSQRELAHRAVHDPLTALASRTLLTERLDQALPEAALITLDLDGFTDLNDALGQATSDALLVEVARRLRTVARHIDTVARIGGDEFAVLLPEATRQRAQLSCVRIMDALRQAYHIGGRRVRMTASLGMVASGGHETAAEALRDADLAMSAAKAEGGDRLVEFQPELREDRLRHAKMATELRAAIEGGELTLHYQPIVTLDTGQAVAVEALARWSPAGADAIPPSQFIPVAEQTGLVVPLGAQVLRDACSQGRRWYERYGTSIAVNISGRQLLEPDFADFVLAVLGDTGLPGSALILEITESVMVAAIGPDGQATTSRLDRLRAHGVRVAIDDFGTGYYSLSYLHRLPIDILKIDSEFIQALDEPVRKSGSRRSTRWGGGQPAEPALSGQPGLPGGLVPPPSIEPLSAGEGVASLPQSAESSSQGRGGWHGLGFGVGLGRGPGRGSGVLVDPLHDVPVGKGTTFASAILRLSQSLQLLSVAEGVETDRQAEILRAMGCPLAQGYRFAYPAPPEDTDRYLASHRQRLMV